MIGWRRRLILSAILAPIMPFSAEVPAKQPELPMMTLKDAIYLAVRSSPNIQNAELDRVTQKFALRIAQYYFDVQYNLDASWSRDLSRTNGGPINGTNRSSDVQPSATLNTPLGTAIDLSMTNSKNNHIYNPEATLSITQPLLRGFGPEVNTADLRDAEDAERLNRLTYKNTVISTISDVIKAYRTLVQSEFDLETAQRALTSDEQTMHQDEALIKAGRKAASDIVQTQAQVASDKVTINQRENSLRQNKQALLTAIGLDPNTPFRVPKDVEATPFHIPGIERSTLLALTNSTTYQGQINAVVSDKRNVAVQKNNALWKVDLNAETSRGGGSGNGPGEHLSSITNGQNYSHSLTLNFNVPINDLTLKQAISNAEIQLRQDTNNVVQGRRDVITSVINALNNIKLSQQSLVTAEEAYRLREQDQEIKDKKAQLGLISTFEQLKGQVDLNNSRSDLISNKVAYLNAITDFESLTGVLLNSWDITLRY